MILPIETVPTIDGLTVFGANPRLLAKLLDALEMKLAQAGAPVQLLRDGLTEGDVTSRLVASGFLPTEEVLVWFAWHDGQTGPDLWPDHGFLSLDQALARSRNAPRGPEPWQWEGPWLPLTGSSRGLAIACEPEQNPNRVRAIDPEPGMMRGRFARTQVLSLCTPIAWWLEELDSGAWAWDSQKQTWAVSSYDPPRDRMATQLL